MPFDFLVLDFETANSEPGSVCQIGLAGFERGRCTFQWGALVDPESPISYWNRRIHGIDDDDVAGEPHWGTLVREIRKHTRHQVLASHTNFDQRVLQAANARYSIPDWPVAAWLDTCRIARLAFPELPGHGLPRLAEHFRIRYQAHDAAEDARAAGLVLLRAVERLNAILVDWTALANPKRDWFRH